MTLVRGFARHVHTLDPETEIPPPDLLPSLSKRQPVFIYPEEDIRALLDAARRLPEPFMAKTYSTLLGLLAAAGLRVGEAIALDRGDVDFGEAILTVRDSKFGKSREVPIHPTVVAALQYYAQERDRRFPPCASGAFFVSLADKRLIYQNVHFVFFQLVDRAGLADRKPRRPRIHDLRHTFASATLRDWYRRGVDVERRLPLLSTYLGHVDPSSTYWYLTAGPEHLALAAERLERHMEGRP
jgi:integrase